jgi:guanylate kinase
MDNEIKRRGLMFVLSSPSGVGKTTLAKMMLQHAEHLHVSISYTTRQIRPGEVDGKDYFFTDRDTFLKMQDQGEFLESVEVFGNLYGTPRRFVESKLSIGEDVLFDVDVQGNQKLTENAREDVVSVFILPPSRKDQLERLRSRSQDSEEVIAHRMAKTNDEIACWIEYDYVIINRDLSESLEKLLSILRGERLKCARRLGIERFVNDLIEEKVDMSVKP